MDCARTRKVEKARATPKPLVKLTFESSKYFLLALEIKVPSKTLGENNHLADKWLSMLRFNVRRMMYKVLYKHEPTEEDAEYGLAPIKAPVITRFEMLINSIKPSPAMAST